jgi:hypothetical protein
MLQRVSNTEVRKLKINPDLLIVLPVKAEDVGDWRGVV